MGGNRLSVSTHYYEIRYVLSIGQTNYRLLPPLLDRLPPLLLERELPEPRLRPMLLREEEPRLRPMLLLDEEPRLRPMLLLDEEPRLRPMVLPEERRLLPLLMLPPEDREGFLFVLILPREELLPRLRS